MNDAGNKATPGSHTASDAAPAGVGVYLGCHVAFLTQHGKEKVVAPTLEAAFGCQVAHVTGYDTDLLGTFTRDIPRAGNQLEAARKKAHLGMQLSGLPLGLASEGSFGPDPMVGMFPWNVELLVFLDDERGLELVGVAQGKANFRHRGPLHLGGQHVPRHRGGACRDYFSTNARIASTMSSAKKSRKK